MLRAAATISTTLGPAGRPRIAAWSQLRRRALSDKSGAPQPRFKSASDRDTYMREANNKMMEYHQARELMRQGKLKSKRNNNANDTTGGRQLMAQGQFAVVGLFVLAFLSTPFLGRKIATDAEFRAKWIPSWYDFTVKAPDKAWTRQELHEQALDIQRDIRERAIRGEFTPEKLEELRNAFQGMEYPHREGMDRSKIPKEWDRVHPSLDDDDDE